MALWSGRTCCAKSEGGARPSRLARLDRLLDGLGNLGFDLVLGGASSVCELVLGRCGHAGRSILGNLGFDLALDDAYSVRELVLGRRNLSSRLRTVIGHLLEHQCGRARCEG